MMTANSLNGSLDGNDTGGPVAPLTLLDSFRSRGTPRFCRWPLHAGEHLVCSASGVAAYGGNLRHPLPFAGQTFLYRGPIPYAIVLFSSWAVAILALKFLKLRLQQRALHIETVPSDPGFVLSPRTVDDVLNRLYLAADDPRQFLLLNRIKIALSNLKNLGRVTDADEILQSLAANDESSMETSYALLQGFIWAIPVLGFIGTVQGLSLAIGGFGSVLSSTSELSQIKDALREVTAGLAIAFETTMQGLVAALCIQLMMTALKKSEEEFLDSCQEYCSRNIVGRLRLMPFEPGREQ